MDHVDGSTHGAVFIITMRHWNTKGCHNAVADKFIQHATMPLDAIDHDRKVCIEQSHSAWRAEFFG